MIYLNERELGDAAVAVAVVVVVVKAAAAVAVEVGLYYEMW